MFKKYIQLLAWAFLFPVSFTLLASCSSTSMKKENAKLDGYELDDNLLGTWVQTGLTCSAGELTKEGMASSEAIKSKMTVAKIVVTSDRVFWDIKEYKDNENQNDFCQVSVEEKWSTHSSDELSISNSDTVVTGNGKVVCDKKYKQTQLRKHKFKVNEKDLSIFLNNSHDAQTGVSTSENSLCKDGQVVLSFHRDFVEE